MPYFKNFPLTSYRFGDNTTSTFFQNASLYVDLIDNITDELTFYTKSFILDGDRPDTLSWKLYGTTDYYWTFFLLNPELRESGWPRPYEGLDDLTANLYPGVFIDYDNVTGYSSGSYTKQQFFDLFDPAIDQTITMGLSTGKYNTVSVSSRRNHDLAQVYLEPISSAFTSRDPYAQYQNPAFSPGDSDGYAIETSLSDNMTGVRFKDFVYPQIDNTVTVNGLTITFSSIELMSEAIHHYENSSKEWSDVTYTSNVTYTTGALAPKTHLEHVTNLNDIQKEIVTFKPEVIEKVVQEFQKAVKE